MRRLAVSMLLFAGAARAEIVRGRLSLVAPVRTSGRALDLDAVFDRVIGAAGLGVTSGKISLQRCTHGHREEVAAVAGRSRIMPLFDLSLHGASIYAHVVF